MNQKEIPDVLRMLMDNETSMSELYMLFMKKFPRTRDFWKRLVIEEKAHADVLMRLGELWNSGKVAFRSSFFSAEALNCVRVYINKQIMVFE